MTIHFSGGRAPSGEVEIAPFVKLVDESLLIQGCGKRGGDLWRFRAGFGPLEPGATDVPLTPDEQGVMYDGEVRFCENSDCSRRDEVITLSDAAPNSWPATGSVLGYDPVRGTFRASLETTNGLGETTQIEVDVQWDASDVAVSGT